MAQVFISYSRKDKDFVSKLGEALAAQEREAWVDWKDIPLTAEWQQEIFANIEAADNFLFIISPESVASANCRKEIDHAVATHKRMVPIFYRAVPDDAIPETLGKFQRIDFDGDVRFDENFAALIIALDTDLAWTQAHTRLLMRAKEWERGGKDSSLVLRGKDLRDAERWVAKSSGKEPSPTTLQSQYILASRQAATKLQRIVIAAVSLAFLIAVGLAIYAFWQTARARARQLVASSISNEDTDPELSILLAAHAVGATWPWGHSVLPEAEDELHHAIMASHVRLTLRGHGDSVDSVAWSPDGKWLATGSADKTAKVWDAASGQEQLTLRGHSKGVDGVAWSPDGKRLATRSGDKTAKVWDAANGRELLTLHVRGGRVDSMAWSPDGIKLATGSADGEAEVWDVDSGQELLTLRGHVKAVRIVAWSPDSNRLATGSWDGTARVWDAASGQERIVLRDRGNSVGSMAWSPDGKRLATGSVEGIAQVWDAVSGHELQALRGHGEAVYSMSWSPDGKRLATASFDKTAKVWDADSGRELLTLRGHGDSVLERGLEPGRQAAGHGKF